MPQESPNTSRAQILGNLGWLFSDRVTGMLGGTLVAILVARYLGPEQYGMLSFAAAFVFLFAFVTDLGLRQIVVQELVDRPDDYQVIMGSAFGLKLAGSLLAMLLATAAVFIFSPLQHSVTPLILALSTGFLFRSLEVIDFAYQSRVLSRYVVYARNLAFVVSGSTKIVLIILHMDLIWFAWATTLDLALAGLALTWFYRRSHLPAFLWMGNAPAAIRLLKRSWPLMFSAFLISIHMRVDQLMIGSMLDTHQLGQYSAAVKLAEGWYFVPAIIVSTLLPVLVALRTRDAAQYEARLMQLYSAMFWGGVLLGVVMWLTGEWLLVLLFGEHYRGGYAALIFNVWAGVFVAQGVARSIWLLGEDLQRFRLYNNLVAVVMNIALNILLIPRMGISGAALATLLTQGLTLWLVSFVWRPMRRSTADLLRSINPRYLFGRVAP